MVCDRFPLKVIALLAVLVGCQPTPNPNAFEADVIIYGGTSAAVIAAVQVAQMGHSVLVVSPDKHLGGLTSGGLGWTDTGDKSVIGGLAREFYHRIYLKYQEPDAWKWQDQEDYGNRGQGTPAMEGDQKTMWIFEPHIAEEVFEDLIRENDIQVMRDEWLNRNDGVEVKNGRISTIRTLSGTSFGGKIFMDASYEGDLMATAGVSYHVGREANSVYNETFNGVQTEVFHHGHYFKENVDPWVIPGDSSSGLLPGISADPPGLKGEGDHRVQAYCFRMCLSNHPDNRIDFPKPDNYQPAQYELLARVFDTGWDEFFAKYDPIPNRKTDTNNHGPFSTDNIGMSYDYPEATYERRKEIVREHELYQKGLMYFVANDPRVPKVVQDEMRRWGLAADEFSDNGNWPQQIYVREARRMIGTHIMTENEVLGKTKVLQPVGMGSYSMDSHNVQRYITPEGYVQNEGDIGVSPSSPYQISYGSLVPVQDEVTNLLVPVCLSSSHIAFGSIRMEPVFMILGQSAATAAVQAIESGSSVQGIDYQLLKKRMLQDGQVVSQIRK